MTDLVAAASSVLATSAARWTALARIDPALLARRPAAGEWSAVECLRHVVDTERSVFRARVLAILDGRDFAAFDPGTDGSTDGSTDEAPDGPSAPELAAELERLRPEALATLAGLVPADLARTGRHAELGVVTMAELLNEWAAHDTMHVVQAERALMQAFIPGSGPWRPYFSDHDVAAAG